MTPQEEYVVPPSADNAAVLFIDNQVSLMLDTQSIDTTLLRTNTEGLAKLAAIYDLPVGLTPIGGGAHGPSGGLITPITETFPDAPIIDRQGYLNAMDDPRFADAVRATGRKKAILSGLTNDFCLVYPTASLIAEALVAGGATVRAVVRSDASQDEEDRVVALEAGRPSRSSRNWHPDRCRWRNDPNRERQRAG